MKLSKILIAMLAALFLSVAILALTDDSAAEKAQVTFEDVHNISLEQAAEFTSRYRANMAENETKIGGMFSRTAIERIMNQDGVMGLRYYHGLNAEGVNVLVLVGVDKDNMDMYQGELAEMAMPCPPLCWGDNPLNSDISLAKAQLIK